MSNFKYKSGTMVSYDIGVIKGQAIVVGVATEGSPLIGKSYILKDPRVNSDVYPYDFFVCPELYIKDDNPNFTSIRVGGKDIPPPPTPPEDRVLIEGKEPQKPPSMTR